MDIGGQIKILKNAVPSGVTLVAVSKTYPAADIMLAYDAGQRIFGESRPQEMRAKYEQLPSDIEWHMIGHLQTNKVKYIAPFVSLIHSVDSARLLEAIDREAAKNGRVIDVLLEVRIAEEETKHGWEAGKLTDFLSLGTWRGLTHTCIRGLMGIATYTDDTARIEAEFSGLAKIFNQYKTKYFDGSFDTLSMGMTSDWELAVQCGATMVRLGSLIFGSRNYDTK